MRLDGTSSIVTGGASGLGAAVARKLAASDCVVIVADLDGNRGRQVAAEIGGKFVRVDVSDPDEVAAAIEIAAGHGPLRSLVNCAGVGLAMRTVGRDGTPHDLHAFNRILGVNLLGTFNCTRLVAAAMARLEPLDDGERGAIVNTASVAAMDGQIGQVAYAASKGGIVGMTLPMARDLSSVGIRVNTIAPGLIDTPIYGSGPDADALKAHLAESVPFPKRLGTANEFASLALELLTNSYMNAETIRVDGAIRLPPPVGMKRTLYEKEHEEFRHLAHAFFLRECAPHTQRWEEQGHVDRDIWGRAGELGLLMWAAPPKFGGLGVEDFRFNAVLAEEFFGCGVAGFGMAVQNDIVAPYLLALATEEQKERWLPKSVQGEYIWSIAMSEPAAGSDLASMVTTAQARDGSLVLNGSKTFITNGLLSNRVIVAAKTDSKAGRRGITLMVIEEDMAGFTRGRKLDKVGQRAQDTAELFFDDVTVPPENVLGEVNRGFYHLMANLPQERLGIAVAGVAAMERALDLTISYVRTRRIFGQPLGAFQNTRFELADLHTLAHACRVYVDRAVEAHCAGELSAQEAAGIKQWVTDRQWELVDRCVQLFGGYGYMNEYEIARLWRDSRVQRIYAGSNEVMKEIVGRSLNLEGEEPPGRPPSEGGT